MARQTIAVSILAEASGVRRGVAQANNSLGSVARGAGRVGLALKGAFVGGAIALGVKQIVGSASDAQQSIGATEQIYGKYANSVIAQSKRAASAVGLSANSYRELSNGLGAMLKNSGTPMDQLGGKTDRLVKLSADLAATFGGTTKDAVEAVGSLMRGEADPIERYGVSIKQSDIKARLAAKGLKDLSGQKLKDAEATARLELLYKQTGSAQGQFGRESNTLAGQQQRLTAQLDNIKARMGTALLPVFTKVATFVNTTVLPAFDKLPPVFERVAAFVRPLVERFREFGRGGGEAGSKMTQLRDTVSMAWSNIQSIFQSAISIVTSLWARFGDIYKQLASSAFGAVINIIQGAFNIISGLFKTVAALLKGDWSGAWAGIKQTVSGAWSVIKGLVQLGWATIRGAFRAGAAAIGGAMSGAWNGAKTATSRGISAVVTYVKGIPGKIKDAIGNLGKILYNAGEAVIQGLIDGIQAKVGALKKKLKSITDIIPGNKGPIEKDRVLLRPAGLAIMDGLIGALGDRESTLRGRLRGITARVTAEAARLGQVPMTVGGDVAGALSAVRGRVTAVAGGVTYYVTNQVTVVAPVGSSPQDIGRELARYLKEYERAGGKGR